MKAFFAKIWAWVLAHKLIAGIIAGATVVVLAVAIAVPCGVSASKKKKAAQEQETQQSQPAGDQGGQQGGGEGQGGGQGGGQAAHEHTWSVAWTSDATSHWHACSGCTEKNDEAAHTTNEYGFCSVCGRYLGAEFAFENQGDYFDFVHEQMDMAANQVYFCRISGAISGHMYELEDGDPWGGDPGTNIDSAVSAYTMIDGQPNVVDLSGTIPSEIGSDGYLYIKLDASNLCNRNDVWFRIVQNHTPNDFGFCSVDGCNHYCGILRTVGVSANYNFQSGKKVFLRYQVVKGHEYYITHSGGLTASEINAYSISSTDGSFVIVPNIKIDGGGVFPADAADSYLYVVITPSDTHYGGLIVNYIGHGSLDSYGFCNACGEYDGKTIVGMNVPDIDLDADLFDFYRFQIKVGHSYDVFDPSLEIPDSWFKGYIRDSETGNMTEVDVKSGTSNLANIGDGYCYIVIEAKGGDIINGQLSVVETHPSNTHGRCDLCGEPLGHELTPNLQFGPVSLDVNETIYLYYTVTVNDAMIEIEYSVNFNTDPVVGFVYKNNTWTQIEYYDGNLNYVDLYTSNLLEVGDIVFFEFTNIKDSQIPSISLELTEL